MNFSQYLRLDEGNYGHDAEKGRLPKKTVTDLDGQPMLDPVTGKPLDADGPVEDEKKVQLDWQVPSLKEDWRQTDPGHTREYEEDEEEEDDGEGSKWDGADNNSTNEGKTWDAVKRTGRAVKDAWKNDRNPNNTDDAVMAGTLGGVAPVLAATGNPALAAGAGLGVGAIASGRHLTQTYKGAKKRLADPKFEHVEIPMRDALGRLSINSINEASKAKLKRKLKSGNTTYAEKQAAMKQLKLKQADQKKRATKRAATEPDLSIAVRAGDAASESSVVLPGGDKPLKRSKLRPGSADLQRHEDEQADSRSSDEGTPRQRHLDK